ncbi:hypothetical protein [Micromonospora zamorensis]
MSCGSACPAQDTVFDRPGRTARETYEVALGAKRAESVPLLC